MIISTSSQNVQLTDAICEYVDTTLHNEFDDVADHIASVDVRLEAIHVNADRFDMRAVLRVDLRSHRALVTEIQDNNLYAAIRRGALDSTRAVERQLRHSRTITGQRPPETFHAFSRYSAPNI
jgi:ribosomal subunit interface protein